MTKLNQILQKQLKRLNITDFNSLTAEKYHSLLEKINKTYMSSDQDRYLIERSMELSSKEMKSLYHNLQEERRKLQSVLSEALCFIDARWRIIDTNLEAEKLLHKNSSEMKGYFLHDILRLYDNFHQLVQLTSLQNNLENNEIYRCNSGKILLNDGADFPASFAFNPLFKDGSYNGAILVFHDIYETVDREKKLKQVIAQAEKVNMAKSQFLAKMSHEIRTPMNAILGIAELLLEENLMEVQKKQIKDIYTSGNHLLHLINDILDFSKIEAGKMVLQVHEFNLFILINNTVNLFSKWFKGKELELKYNIDKNVPYEVIPLCQASCHS